LLLYTEKFIPEMIKITYYPKQMRNLIYFVIGGDIDYFKLLLYCINTIRCYQENDEYVDMITTRTLKKQLIRTISV